MAEPTDEDNDRRIEEPSSDDAARRDSDYEVYVREAIEAGLKGAREGRTVPHAGVRRRFGLTSR